MSRGGNKESISFCIFSFKKSLPISGFLTKEISSNSFFLIVPILNFKVFPTLAISIVTFIEGHKVFKASKFWVSLQTKLMKYSQWKVHIHSYLTFTTTRPVFCSRYYHNVYMSFKREQQSLECGTKKVSPEFIQIGYFLFWLHILSARSLSAY